MYFSIKEKTMMRKLFCAINENKDELYTLTFSDGSMVKAKVDTCYETDNGKDVGEEGFEEYHACAMRIVSIIVDASNMFNVGGLIEINYHSYPEEIRNSKGEIL